MKRFLAVYMGSATAAQKQAVKDDPDTRQKGVTAWGQWVSDHAASIVNHGSPLGKTLKVSKAGVEPTRNGLAAYVVVEAASHEEAARMFEGHPHFTIFPGDSVEILECLPLPGA